MQTGEERHPRDRRDVRGGGRARLLRSTGELSVSLSVLCRLLPRLAELANYLVLMRGYGGILLFVCDMSRLSF